MYFLILLLSLTALADTESRLNFDKSFPRDNTFCQVKKKRIEILIRDTSRMTEPKDKGYGEMLFVRAFPDKTVKQLKLNKGRSDTLKFFLGAGSLCSKVHGHQIDDKTFALLLLKENRPFTDKLVIQFFGLPDLNPLDFLETNFPTDKAVPYENGFAFRTLPEDHSSLTGKVTIEGETFIFQEKKFPKWMSYKKREFSVHQELTYEKFPWKEMFIDQLDFETQACWNQTAQNYQRQIVYLAVSHKLKKQCLLLTEKKISNLNEMSWRCQPL